MSIPASETTRSNLSANMSKLINECFPLLRNCVKGLSKLEDIYKSNSIDDKNYNDYKNVLEFHSSLLYVIIEVACVFRADFKSSIAIEKRTNLKYIVYITSEFFKSVFYKENKSLWNDVSTHLSTLNIDAINSGIINVNENISRYKDLYYDKDKNDRDISVHYDYDIIKLYKYVVGISEEKESQRLCAFLAIVQPLNKLLTFYTSVILFKLVGEDTTELSETKFEHDFFEKFKEKNYKSVGDSIQHFSELLDKNMRIYSTVDRLPSNITSILGEESVQKIKSMRNYASLSLILHYIYIDLGTTIRGYLQSESYIEKRWILIRINVIIYEGWKKIYKQQPNGEKSLWEQFIYAPLILIEDEAIKEEITTVNCLLDAYKEYKQMEEIRHKYIHLRKHKKNNLPDLFNELLKFNSYKELNKSLDFLKLLPRIIKLNIKSMQIAAEEENNINRKKLQQPFNLIKSKILKSNMSEDKKTKLLNTIEDGESKIMSIFD